MTNNRNVLGLYSVLSFLVMISCVENNHETSNKIKQIPNILDFSLNPDFSDYRKSLVFSDQGAWFGYGLNNEKGGFSGPFIMSQENGTWISSELNKLTIFNKEGLLIDFKLIKSESYLSNLKQTLIADGWSMQSALYYKDSLTVIIQYRLQNTGEKEKIVSYKIDGSIINPALTLQLNKSGIIIKSDIGDTEGVICFPKNKLDKTFISDTSYQLSYLEKKIQSKGELVITITNSFCNTDTQKCNSCESLSNIENNSILDLRNQEKDEWLSTLSRSIRKGIITNDSIAMLINKCIMTMQNNWRSASGELKYAGLFPSYHYYWFHGFWAWDSWKHAYALAKFNPNLAKKQVLAMFEFMEEDGFIADCIYRDTLIEKHNFRNTKPPLASWAVWNIFINDSDTGFLEKVYPMLVKQHQWWYNFRDHDNDKLCEYGSTDGSLIAAKWESGMDNAVRFDNSRILQNAEGAFSLNQESVDLNSYLFKEKQILSKIASILGYIEDSVRFIKESEDLKTAINNQFYDMETGWYYDSSIEGDSLIMDMGCEGWIPLWANAADIDKAKMVKANMLDHTKFNKKVPLQTLAGDNTRFKPDHGYWRGPVWLDQAYFGVIGLRNYGYSDDADNITRKLLLNSEGLLSPGSSIRENYNPITGDGMEAQNFSWSAAHFLLLIIQENTKSLDAD